MVAYRRIEDVPLYRYGLIMADPPWRFEHWGEPNERSADHHYQTMGVSEIMALPVERLLAPSAYLVLWTHPSMPPSLGERVLEAWGLRFVTTGWWTKTQKKDPSKPKMGMGRVLRDCGEPFLVGSIGKPGVKDRGIPSVIMAPRREHSRKPEDSYRMCERLAPDGSWMLDLFSRQERPGWDCMGDQHDLFEVAS